MCEVGGVAIEAKWLTIVLVRQGRVMYVKVERWLMLLLLLL